MARPRKEIDWGEFEKLCSIQATKEEIAGWFRVSEDTILRRVEEEYGESFATVFAKNRQDGKISLRRKQMQVALGGNPTMLIWLGKQYLNQKDQKDITIPAENAEKLILQFGDKKDK